MPPLPTKVFSTGEPTGLSWPEFVLSGVGWEMKILRSRALCWPLVPTAGCRGGGWDVAQSLGNPLLVCGQPSCARWFLGKSTKTRCSAHPLPLRKGGGVGAIPCHAMGFQIVS